jgi:hypothetical protein
MLTQSDPSQRTRLHSLSRGSANDALVGRVEIPTHPIKITADCANEASANVMAHAALAFMALGQWDVLRQRNGKREYFREECLIGI